MAVLDFLKDTVEDLVTLEVATLTNPTDEKIPLKKELKDAEDAKLKAAEKDVSDARNKLITKITAADSDSKRKDIRNAKKVVKEKQKVLNELKDALGVFDPKDIFSHIRANLTEAELVAYSRFELEGDSVNFINNKESLQGIAAAHKEMVGASQEARKALFDTVAKLF